MKKSCMIELLDSMAYEVVAGRSKLMIQLAEEEEKVRESPQEATERQSESVEKVT